MNKYAVEITVYVKADNEKDAAREVNNALSYVMVVQGLNITGASIVEPCDVRSFNPWEVSKEEAA